jgi:hypothetical protein
VWRLRECFQYRGDRVAYDVFGEGPPVLRAVRRRRVRRTGTRLALADLIAALRYPGEAASELVTETLVPLAYRKIDAPARPLSHFRHSF